MICPYCGAPMKRYAEDSQYRYYHCKAPDCPHPEAEHMDEKSPEERKAATAAAEADMRQRRSRRGW